MQIDIIAYLIIYRVVAVLVAGGRLPGSSGGGASLVAGVLVAGASLGGWWLPSWFLARIFTAGHAGGGHARLLSAAALSLVNRSCKESLLDAIALIINYLGVPFGMAFTGWLFS